jgi:hypothetical protein
MIALLNDLIGPMVWITQAAILVIAALAYMVSRAAKKELDARGSMFVTMTDKLDQNRQSIESIHEQINSRMDQLIASVTLASRQDGVAEGLATSKAARESATADAQQITDAIHANTKKMK